MDGLSTWKRLLTAPRSAFDRLHALTPSSVWEGAGLGLLAVAAGGAALVFHGLTAWIERS